MPWGSAARTWWASCQSALSCSTTFELGVDVGELQAVVLRDMPPSTADCVQRAGRAGRRADSAALVLTYAQRRPHDLARFAEPRRMIAGEVRPPIVPVDNVRIDRRHAHSIALAAFFRAMKEERGRTRRTAGEFFLPDDTTGGTAAHPRARLAHARPGERGGLDPPGASPERPGRDRGGRRGHPPGEQPDDIDGTVHTGADGMPSLLLFGTTPGGAGNAIRIGEHLEPVVEAALARVGGCECGPESSCHACLRTFRNERFHESLSRGEAVVLLDALAGRSTS
ncbi:hypothetical protein SUDANB176_06688 [Streptomyces sp. enrichment culture]|uniref:DUF1998 domain-containing protein n=1 Tax=Streptomyces sp. enrichment culture TaxID=1795815 RepID=UPI003F54685A